MTDQKRRTFMKGVLGVGIPGTILGTGAFPLFASAASGEEWPAEAFEVESVDEVIESLYGKSATESDKISVSGPNIAQNGAVVPVGVEASLPNVTAISLLVANNPSSLAASFDIPKGTQPYVQSRLKMAETSDVIALVESDGQLYRASKNIKVTVGGCGG